MLSLYGALMSKLGKARLFHTTEIKKFHFTSFGGAFEDCGLIRRVHICDLIRNHTHQIYDEIIDLKDHLVQSRGESFKSRMHLLSQTIDMISKIYEIAVDELCGSLWCNKYPKEIDAAIKKIAREKAFALSAALEGAAMKVDDLVFDTFVRRIHLAPQGFSTNFKTITTYYSNYRKQIEAISHDYDELVTKLRSLKYQECDGAYFFFVVMA